MLPSNLTTGAISEGQSFARKTSGGQTILSCGSIRPRVLGRMPVILAAGDGLALVMAESGERAFGTWVAFDGIVLGKAIMYER
jgi:hypothetical protein